ncbi:hypothetical protein SAMN06297280_2325 [Arsukibacterium tuosuense]|uniref:Uncharacterized protein n=1 Tax=Arsukibacterium tuosuense TaxID=1323745 RepID=A0A285J1D3_9GAMM|nr:hypothetical protein [Arsukibacterium tuosuense]SNY53176.1 hypothetical protein SAMN06297280_2325 [Arsukibacterium tuosuense]
MKLSNLLISILTATTLAAGFAAFKFHSANERHVKDYVALSELNLQLTEDLKKLQSDMSAYQLELQTSKTSVASLNEELLELKRAPVLQERTAVPDTHPRKVETFASDNIEMKKDTDILLAFANRIRSGESISSIEDKALKQFREEEVDGNWAYEYEANIRDLVLADEENKFDIQELTCKASICELKITANENNAMNLGTLFSKALGEQDWRDKSASVMFNHEVKDGVMRILIGRDKHSLN